MKGTIERACCFDGVVDGTGTDGGGGTLYSDVNHAAGGDDDDVFISSLVINEDGVDQRLKISRIRRHDRSGRCIDRPQRHVMVEVDNHRWCHRRARCRSRGCTAC